MIHTGKSIPDTRVTAKFEKHVISFFVLNIIFAIIIIIIFSTRKDLD